MEMRCTNCGHIGQAASVLPSAKGLTLICANCTHENILEFDAPAQPSTPDATPDAAADAPSTPTPTTTPAPSAPYVHQKKPQRAEDAAVTQAMLDRLVPPPGEGLRCRKCINLIAADDVNCVRCGLNIEESLRFKVGEAPWERAPEGKEDAWAQATLLWESLQQHWSEERLNNYTAFIKDEGLHDLGIRHLRLHLVDEPDEPLVLHAMTDIAAVMQSRLVIAKHQVAQDKQEFAQEVSKIRGILMVSTLVFWVAIFVFFGGLFLKNCG